MAQDATEVVVGGDGGVFVADTGTTAPTNATTALAAGFTEVGYVSEDGATITLGRTIEDIGAWQSFEPIRKVVSAREFMVAFAIRQWNSRNLIFALGGGTVHGSGAAFTYTPPDPSQLAESALVLEWQDGSRDYRLYVPRGIVTENVETQVTRTAAADLPITFAGMPVDSSTPIFKLFTNDDAFVAAS